MAQERWVFPLDCPECTSGAGYPYKATTLQGSVTAVRIALRCRACRHEWKLDWDTDPLPDPDEGPQRDQ
jgi:hypothetical protein